MLICDSVLAILARLMVALMWAMGLGAATGGEDDACVSGCMLVARRVKQHGSIQQRSACARACVHLMCVESMGEFL